MKTLVKRARAIAHSTVALQMITGCASLGPKSRDPLPEYADAELRRFIARAPDNDAERERYTTVEKLHGCIRILRRGNNGIRMVAFRSGMVIASHVLTPPYVAARTGFAPPQRRKTGRSGDAWNGGVYPTNDDDLGEDEPGPTLQSAIMVMVEASRVLRHRLSVVAMSRRACDGWETIEDEVPPAESLSYSGIGGDDPADHAVGFLRGECGWADENERINQIAPEARGNFIMPVRRV